MKSHSSRKIPPFLSETNIKSYDATKLIPDAAGL